MVPLNPPLHVQPEGTLNPRLKIGHETGEQEPEKKSGDMVVATTDPENPALQVQDVPTPSPLELAGHATF